VHGMCYELPEGGTLNSLKESLDNKMP
jgi:hypothetical protein